MNKIFLFLLLFIGIECKAQVNLVLNPSFEIIDSCWQSYDFTGAGTLQYCTYWFTPFSYPFPAGGGSTELYSDCSILPEFSIPANWVGYQMPHSGDNYSGFVLIGGGEYIEGQLSDTLQAGKRYCIKFYYSYADSTGLLSDGLGVLFTQDSLMRLDSLFNLIHMTPQVEQDFGYVPWDTMNWLFFNKSFIAQGGEKYFAVGAFGNANEHTIVEFNPFVTGNFLCYIYVDDFSVTLCEDTTDIVETPWWESSVSLFPNPSNDLVELRCGGSPAVTIFDAVGHIVYGGYEKLIATSPFADGPYIVRVLFANGVVVNRKLFVQH